MSFVITCLKCGRDTELKDTLDQKALIPFHCPKCRKGSAFLVRNKL